MREGLYLAAVCAVTITLPLLSADAPNSAVANHCQAAPVRSEALDHPSKHAWDLFLLVNHPAVDRALERGQPDCTKHIGTPGTTSVWETWRNANSEVFVETEPPQWNDTTLLPDEKPGQVPQPRMMAQARSVGANELLSFHTTANRTQSDGRPTILFSPGDDGVFNNRGGFGETRINRTTYEFIRRNCLYNTQAVQRYAAAIEEGKRPRIELPVDSMEVKAAWLDFERELIPVEKQRTFYTAEYQGKKYGLNSLHILTKDTPNWFWATFHHQDTPTNPFETLDTFGRPRLLDGTVWVNYKLGGTQVDFTTPTGSATILSDHYVEFGFQRSSCITCHATATISRVGPMPKAQQRAVCAITPAMAGTIQDCKQLLGDTAFKPGTDQLVMERGVPDPTWFEIDGRRFYQTDFLWSIPFRAYRVLESGAPPTRCVW
jgi:hypothetical protein